MNLTRVNWPAAWTPSADQNNGDPSGLLRMDNLTIDEDGAITLIRGYEELIGDLPDYVYRTYSRLIGGTEFIWAALNLSASSVIRTSDLFSSYTTILSGGGGVPCFGDCLGQVIISAGLHRLKDTGTGTPKILGIETPTAFPVINQINQQYIDIDTIGTWSAVEGTGFEALDPSALIFVDPTTLIGIILDTYNGDVDSVNFGVTSLDRNGDPSQDLFTMLFQPGSTSNFIKFRVEFACDVGANFSEYYWIEFPVTAQGTTTGNSFLLGTDVQSTISCMRSDFTRVGRDANRGWTTLTACRITGYAIAVDKFVAGQQAFTGGVQGSLNSDYQYIAINVADNGVYRAMSGVGPVSPIESIYNGYASIQLPPASDSQITATWLFRQSVVTARTAASNLGLPQYYRVAIGTPGSTVTDNVTDETALEDNITLNLALTSLLNITDIFIGMCFYNSRMLYLTNQNILLSDLLDPDAIDTRYTISAFGDPTEVNLWIHALTNDTLILATSKDLYYISGTLTSLPDGSLDITIQPIGEAYPPLSQDYAFTDGNLFYVASDGIRYTTGSNSLKISQSLDLLFQGMNRFGVPGINIVPDNGTTYALSVGRGRLYVSLFMTDTTRWLLVYNIKKQVWYIRYTDPISIFTTQKDEVILGYALGSSSSNNNLAGGLFLTDSGNGITDSSGSQIEGFPFNLQTIYDCNNQPRNRKDTFTLKLVMNTGGRQVNVSIAKDGNSFVQVGTANSNAQETFYYNLSPYTLGFRYALQITDQNLVTYFKLWEYTIEYDARPEQQVYLRLQPSNGGSLARKRWISYSIVIDTLGSPVTMVIMIDNVAVQQTTVTTFVKATYNYYFPLTSNNPAIEDGTVGTDISAILYSSTPFEFYGLNEQGIVSESLPSPATFLVIPANDYGKPRRKRFTSFKFQINTRGANVTYTPIVDGSLVSGFVYTFSTTTKRTVEVFIPTNIDLAGIDIGGTLSSANNLVPFEFYGTITPEDVELLPAQLQSYYIEYVNFGSPYRKRFRTIPIVINTMGNDVVYTPIIDGVQYEPLTLNTQYKQTVNYYFTFDMIGVDIGGSLISQNGIFEYWELSTPQNLEILPQPAEYTVIPPNNYGKPNRKRFTSFKFVIDARGGSVKFTPIVDGTPYNPFIFTTLTKQTVEYFFEQSLDVKGIDIGGILESVSGVPFEYYNVIEPQEVETLPARLESLYTPFTNYGSAAYKRIRTIPFVIDTYGKQVLYAPIIDGIQYPAQSFITSYKQTVYYFFTTDVFGIDIGGQFTANSPFEFYGYGQPENVEILPVPKKFDQFQPIRFDKIGKLFSLRVRMIVRGSTTNVPFNIYIDQETTPNVNPYYSSSFTVVPLQDTVTEIELPKNLNGSIFRIELGPTYDMFHRYDLQVKASSSGMESDSQWITLR